MKLKLSKKEWDLIIKALGKMEFTEEDYDKLPADTDAGQAEILAERIDIEFCKHYNV